MKRRLSLFWAVLILAASPLACARTARPPAQSPASASAPTETFSILPSGESEHTLTHDGRERNYLLYVPVSVDWSQPVALVLVFHGGTGNGKSARVMSGFDQVADQHGFIVAYPDGSGRLSDDIILTWNGGECCGYAQKTNVDDVGFARAIVAELQSQMNVDAKRIYASGMSNGGILSQRLACEASDLFAAIAPVAGTLNVRDCVPSEPLSVIEFHGTADLHLPYDGGVGEESLAGVDFNSVAYSIQFWTAFNNCESAPLSESFADIQHETWTCPGGINVELYTILGGGHAWPGGRGGWPGADEPTQSISASQLIWEFFAVHPKP
ncbi:MAG: hypothetical protein HFACDABA_01032 [Anaerolineales bacterium]|nr:hypothetical protein [Anaerolineales bacterium]